MFLAALQSNASDRSLGYLTDNTTVTIPKRNVVWGFTAELGVISKPLLRVQAEEAATAVADSVDCSIHHGLMILQIQFIVKNFY